jgi:hypothetical protein
MPLLGTAAADIESEFHAGYSSDYVFRGGQVGGNLFEFGFDFAGSGDVGPLGELDWSAGIWYATFDALTRIGADGANNELDVYGEVSKSLSEMFSVAVGITNYSYFGNGGAADDDIEPYISLGAAINDNLSLGATAFYDGSNNYIHDWYFEFGAAYERELCQNTTAGLEVVLGWFDESNAVPGDDDDIYVRGTASLSYAVSENITVTPYASVSFSDNLGDRFYGGVSVGFGF